MSLPVQTCPNSSFRRPRLLCLPSTAPFHLSTSSLHFSVLFLYSHSSSSTPPSLHIFPSQQLPHFFPFLISSLDPSTLDLHLFTFPLSLNLFSTPPFPHTILYLSSRSYSSISLPLSLSNIHLSLLYLPSLSFFYFSLLDNPFLPLLLNLIPTSIFFSLPLHIFTSSPFLSYIYLCF